MVRSTLNGPTVPLSVIDDGDVRVIFKIYFMVVIIAIAFFGGYCVTFNIRRWLLKGKAVPLTATTGWIHGPLLAKIGYQLRRLPGGWLGVLMLLTTALEFISDIGVAKTITLVTQRARTLQDNVMIVGDPGLGYSRYPDVVFTAFNWAKNAQDYSYNNQNLTGLGETQPYGIYRVLNQFDYYYMPTEEDFLGYWGCSHQTPSAIVYNYTLKGNDPELYDSTILFDLVKRGLMYNYTGGGDVAANFSIIDNGTYVGPSFHLVLWTASSYTLGSAPNFTFAIETRALDSNGSKQMDVFECSLYSTDANNTVQNILRAIDIQSTPGRGWLATIAGAVYPGVDYSNSYDIPTLEATLNYYLNAMIMVAGSLQETDHVNARHLTYGVFEYATVIPYWIIAVAVVTFALLLFMIGYMIFLVLSNRRLKRAYEKEELQGVPSKQIFDHTPVGLLGWMSQAAATSRDSELPKEGQLRKWILSTTWHGEKRLGVVKEEEHGLMDGERHGSEDTYVKEESQQSK